MRLSIDSDVDNLTALLRVLNLLPKTIEFGPLRHEAKSQLHAEADYRLEASYLRRFAECVADDHRFRVPDVLFLNRKLGGLYLLFTRLQATVPVRQLLTRYIEPQDSTAIQDGERLAG